MKRPSYFVPNTLTARQRVACPDKYVIKDARTRVYRALFGDATRSDKGKPWANESRKLPQDWDFQRILATFHSLASTETGGQYVSNGLFPLDRYKLLRARLNQLESLNAGKSKRD